MSTPIIAVVLIAALMHAGWNTIAKLNAGRAGDAAVVTETGAEWLTKYPRGLAVLG